MTAVEDRRLSPYTGWAREHWAAYADRLLAAAGEYRSPAGARLDLPGPASRNGRVSDGLEGFARTFLIAGFRVAGENGADPGGYLEHYARGLAAGTDPASPEAWPRPDELGQAKVEAASIALVLQLTRPWLWDRLDDAVRDRVVVWLATVIGQPYPPINWVWFRIVVESFLREVGGPWSAADVEEDLAVHASLRRPGGWLSDGDERAYDHYTGWALHLYPLLWTHLFDVTGTLCPGPLRHRWAADLRDYLDDAVRLVGSDGSPLLQGRSLVYRFAAAAPFWVGAFTGTSGLAPGLTRRVAGGMVRHFADRSAPDGLLGLGWHHAWPAMRQAYSGPGSPYWAAKGLLGLALPPHHPVWTDVEEPLPIETGDVARVVAAPGWLVSGRRRDGIALVVNHGTDHARPGDPRADSPLYARLGYSTATFPLTSSPDNAVYVLDADGRASHRAGFSTCYAIELPGGVLAAASQGRVRWVDTTGDDSPDHGSGRSGPVVPGPVLTVASVVRQGVEVRLARLDDAVRSRPNAVNDSFLASDARNESFTALRLSGWPVSGATRPVTRTGAEPGARCGPEVTATAETPELRSTLRNLRGFTTAAVAVEAGTSPLGEWTAIPFVATEGPPEPGAVFAAVVVLDRGGPDDADPSLAVAADGHHVTLTWPDGVTAEVPLPAAPS
ncbi:hypothetical protein AMES_3156 [Amycolatopsis mediterranei S699]|uniref:DUF2264 domain-containing protein n=2 Tax=Amycolatopsis mediterranei TaxID=33910 RepID=A0A0H3D428_AMYMU|nr:DUF2264 domain-containing protein [Amycolatopsis mediterranei]ADJ44981.1 conserved hypothetical protein [Amycolatopsis mediterranei U32]AEK41732.1 hypothetical protein RAM_16220 [Amycolatopsis mediterranei S699]AFO76692.1 hypothetical protein AMES_3156 [Amycolatopsis mediterranei S699]AGT83820.1 hypothetical protein B737_3156 [Amycolatopsis mediterranei RB]KDO07194.1 hypothetical protein DV26_28315 [Amycolatopsis mediterranei]